MPRDEERAARQEARRPAVPLLAEPAPSCLSDEGGQAIMLLLLVAVSMLLFLTLMFRAGVIITLRMQLQNVADLSAMAGAVVQAQGMQQIARLNSGIVDTVIAANRDAFGRHAPFASDAAAQAYIDAEYLSRIRRLLNQIEAVQRSSPGQAMEAAETVARRNVEDVSFFWRAPRMPGGRLVELRERKNAEFHYVRKKPSDPFKKHRKFQARAHYRGKTGRVVYTAVELRLEGLDLSDEIFESGIEELVAYAAAKPWGGTIGGFENPLLPRVVVTRWDLLPWQNPFASLFLPKWSGIAALPHDPLDYDAWLVRIGDPRLDPPPRDIPDHEKFLH